MPEGIPTGYQVACQGRAKIRILDNRAHNQRIRALRSSPTPPLRHEASRRIGPSRFGRSVALLSRRAVRSELRSEFTVWVEFMKLLSWLCGLGLALAACGGTTDGGGAQGGASNASMAGGANASGGVTAGGVTGNGGTYECGGSDVCGATGGNLGNGGFDNTTPPELGKACTNRWDCGARAACDIASGQCVWPCGNVPRDTKTVTCGNAQECLVIGPDPGVCVSTCKNPSANTNAPPNENTCPQGLECDFGTCKRPGSATLAMPCTGTHVSTGCISGLLCPFGRCVTSCDADYPTSHCPGAEQCGKQGFCTEGEAAPLGALCNALGLDCGGDGNVWRGDCLTGECLQPCNPRHPCPSTQTCERLYCRTSCDAHADDPGCPSGQLCSGGFCSSLPGDSAELQEPCSDINRYCASNGRAFLGKCSTAGGTNVCRPVCNTDADCNTFGICDYGACIIPK